jgi:altered-inheritance-of-mitochondria protein 5
MFRRDTSLTDSYHLQTGGVTLTLGVAYLTVLAHRRNREQQAAVLRQQTYLLSGIVDPLPPKLPPTRAELAAAERANLTEVAKDRWNAEIEHAVRWAQSKDWVEVREGVEGAISRLWVRALGEAQEDAEKGEQKARDLTSKARGEAREKTDSVAAAAKTAYADAKAKSVEVANKAEEKAEDAKDAVLGAIGKGIEKSKEVLVKAKSAAVGAEEKIQSSTLTVSPVEKALQQRYEKRSGLDQTVEEVLAARYVPIDQKDNTNLKAL